MPEKLPKIKDGVATCKVLLDRVQFLAGIYRDRPPEITRFAVTKDSFFRPQAKKQARRRLRVYKNSKTETTVNVAYDRVLPWLREAKVTVIPNDSDGVSREELEQIFKAFEEPELSLVEVAFDFPAGSGVNREYVWRHCLFGRSEAVEGRIQGDFRSGTRHSQTMVRGYHKEFIGYRIELELHRSWLVKKGLKTPADIVQLSTLLIPDRMQFVKVDWDKLSVHLAKKGLHIDAIINHASVLLERSLDDVLWFLGHDVGLSNVWRFLQPLEINHEIQQRLQAWTTSWRQFRARHDK